MSKKCDKFSEMLLVSGKSRQLLAAEHISSYTENMQGEVHDASRNIFKHAVKRKNGALFK